MAEHNMENHKGYVIYTEEGTEKGVFFRSPLKKVSFDAYCDSPIMSAWKYLNDIKNPIRRFYEILIGNGNIVKHIQKWSEDLSWGGFEANIICSPIYFKRQYRKLTAYSCEDENIKRVESHGYESEFNMCSGACDVERTVFTLKTGKRIKVKRLQYYHYTYAHIVERIIDTGSID